MGAFNCRRICVVVESSELSPKSLAVWLVLIALPTDSNAYLNLHIHWSSCMLDRLLVRSLWTHTFLGTTVLVHFSKVATPNSHKVQ